MISIKRKEDKTSRYSDRKSCVHKKYENYRIGFTPQRRENDVVRYRLNAICIFKEILKANNKINSKFSCKRSVKAQLLYK